MCYTYIHLYTLVINYIYLSIDVYSAGYRQQRCRDTQYLRDIVKWFTGAAAQSSLVDHVE